MRNTYFLCSELTLIGVGLRQKNCPRRNTHDTRHFHITFPYLIVTIRNMSSALNNSKPQKQNFPDKLAHPTERERKRIGKVIPEVPGGRRKWSLEEEEALINGYTKYENQKEMWSKILNDPAFSETLKYRDNVALKDKWRNLARK